MLLAPTYIKNVFCLEGEFSKDLREKASVLPALGFLQQNFDVRYIYKKCTNRESVEYFAGRWKDRKYSSYSIGYFSFHGEPGRIEPGFRDFIKLEELGEILQGSCKNKVIHFGTCKTIHVEEKRIRAFLRTTGALCVSGYTDGIDFFQGGILDMIYIDLLQKYKSVARVHREIRKLHPVMVQKLGFKMIYARS
jgi:hypothetical protein